MTLGPNRKTDLTVQFPEELMRKLVERVNGHDVSEYLAALIRADLEQPAPTADPEFAKSVEFAGRFMDRYQDAYRELSK